MKYFVTLFALVSIQISVGNAEVLNGEKKLKLLENDGREHTLATVKFSSEGDRTHYEIDWNDEAFTDQFLSMRPFKCLQGTTKYWCRVPYPYDIKRVVQSSDLTDLEYDTLFVWKGATEYGINMWNGVYYKMETENGKIVGRIHEMDMNILAAPPETGNLRPVGEFDIEPGEPDSHWLPNMVIE